MATLPITVISTVLNEARDISRLVESLLALDPAPAQVIIVDGGSTDGTWEILDEAQRVNSLLRAIRDESCSLRFTPGPISRGRNVAIAAATTPYIACVDAGCSYQTDWLARIAAPLLDGQARYALGGSCLALDDATVWDLASAPFLGVKLSPDVVSKSCTARSTAFTRELWAEIGGFPEHTFLSEDTLFDLEARRRTPPAFVTARAYYHPRNSYSSACRQLGRYAAGDGGLGVRKSRLARNLARCVVEIAALGLLYWTWIPLAVIVVLELYFAFERDRLQGRATPAAILARIAYAFSAPWVVATGYLRGALARSKPVASPHNATGPAD
ncbi:MAG: glycosyltransferase [Terracidiphilus sp.]|nr:glycosyltransferase [Terracidiphilus sp.]